MRIEQVIGGLLLLLAASGCNNAEQSSSTANTVVSTGIPVPKDLAYKVVKVYPHDSTFYTQGLAFLDGQLYEGTGGSPEYSHYKSFIGKIDLATGKPLQQVFLDTNYFGEGITPLKSKFYQLTWHGNKGFVYDAKTLKRLAEFPLKTEGWGITTDSTSLIISDGSSNLYFLDPDNFSTQRIVSVSDNNGPINNLNELEYINGYIYANRYQYNYIYKIDPSNGQVAGILNLDGILAANSSENLQNSKYASKDAVLNGIAYDPASGKLYVTGKLWPQLYEIAITAQ
ncbi:MAG: glutaminyl-peptide cyclotransferase [Flavihumibacter sp.]